MFERLVKSSGGFEEASTNAHLQNSFNQIYALCRKQKSNNTKDEIVELVDLCNVQKGLPNAFIRDVRIAPELAVMVTNDQQLKDIPNFCATDHCWCILGADPTFNICSLTLPSRVTAIQYCTILIPMFILFILFTQH